MIFFLVVNLEIPEGDFEADDSKPSETQQFCSALSVFASLFVCLTFYLNLEIIGFVLIDVKKNS